MLAPAVLAVCFSTSPWPLWCLSVVALTLGTLELRRIAGFARERFSFLGTLLLAAVGPFSRAMEVAPAWPIAVLATLGVGACSIRAPSSVGLLESMRFQVATLYLAAPLAALIGLHGMGTGGTAWNWGTPILMALVPIWVGDTAAIFVGRAWGKRPLATAISPKKTVEGGIANLAGCMVAGALLASALGHGWALGLATGLACGVLGQIGDLFESWLKRREDLKDSGTLLPGHGGILDRIDSVLFAAPVVFWIVTGFAARF